MTDMNDSIEGKDQITRAVRDAKLFRMNDVAKGFIQPYGAHTVSFP